MYYFGPETDPAIRKAAEAETAREFLECFQRKSDNEAVYVNSGWRGQVIHAVLENPNMTLLEDIADWKWIAADTLGSLVSYSEGGDMFLVEDRARQYLETSQSWKGDALNAYNRLFPADGQ